MSDKTYFGEISNTFVSLENGPTLSAVVKTDWRKDKALLERNLHMLHNEVLCDVTLVVGENTKAKAERIRAHSFILASGSSVFYKLLSEAASPHEVTISIPDVRPATFRIILEYLYTDKIDINPSNVSVVLRTAKKLKIHRLVSSCLSYLQDYITEETVCAVLEQGISFQHQELIDRCLRYIDKNTASVLKTKSFKHCSLDCILKIAPRDSLIVREDELFDGLMSWAFTKCEKMKLPKNSENARKMMGEAFYHIRFPMMNPQNFTNKVANISILTDSEKVNLFRYFYGAERPQMRFSDKPRQWNKRASGILFIKPHPDIFSQGSLGSNMF